MTKRLPRRLPKAHLFAFGGIGYAGITSNGEIAFKGVFASDSAAADFLQILKTGTPQAQCYALVGLRLKNRPEFDEQVKRFASSKDVVQTCAGCIMSKQPMSSVVANIQRGYYDESAKAKLAEILAECPCSSSKTCCAPQLAQPIANKSNSSLPPRRCGSSRLSRTGKRARMDSGMTSLIREWVVLLKGSATLLIAEEGSVDLGAGDYLLIPAHVRHRVERTSEDAVWLAVHFRQLHSRDVTAA